MEHTELIKNLFDKKTVMVLQIFFNDDSKQYYLREISSLSKVSPATTFRILKKLVDLKILKVNKIEEYKTAKLYSLNSTNDVEFLKTIFKPDMLNNFIEQVKEIKEIEEIYLYGKKEKSKATIFIIAEQIDKTKIKQKILEFRQQKNFNIMDNYFTKEQLSQIESLFSESKKLIYKRES